jgi:PAS domain S-box-containing protein
MEPVRANGDGTPVASEPAGAEFIRSESVITQIVATTDGARTNGDGSNGSVVSTEAIGVLANCKAALSIFDTAIIGVAAWDGGGVIREANRTFLEMMGYGAEDLRNDLRIDTLIRSDIPQRADDTSGVELALARRDGETVWCLTNGSLPRTAGADGIGLFVDISKRRAREEEMSVLYDALRATVNAVLICNCEGDIEWVNPAFTRTTGYAAEEVV